MATIIPFQREDVYIRPLSINYWWSVHGLEPSCIETVRIRIRQATDLIDILTKDYFANYSGSDRERDLAIFNRDYEQIMALQEVVVYSEGFVLHPASVMTYQVTREAITAYCHSAYGIHSPKLRFLQKPRRSDVVRSFQEEQHRRKSAPDHYSIIIPVPFLLDQYTVEELQELGIDPNNVDHGFMDHGHPFVRLKDGSQRPIRRTLKLKR